MRKKILLVVWLCLQGAFAQEIPLLTTHQHLELIQQKVHSGEFAEAWTELKSLPQEALSKSYILYNLGILQFEQGRKDEAYLHFRKAYQLSPKEGSILKNLILTKIVLQKEGRPIPQLSLTQKLINTFFTPAAELVTWLLASVCIALWLLPLSTFQRALRRATHTLLALLLVGFFCVKMHWIHESALILESTPLKNAPDVAQPTVTSLHTGQSVKLLPVPGQGYTPFPQTSRQKAWAFVQTQASQKEAEIGWIPTQTLLWESLF